MPSDLRATITQAVKTDTELIPIYGDRWFQFGSLTKQPKTPYGVIKMGIDGPIFNWRLGPSEKAFQIWLHDKPGDYSRIDLAVDRLKIILPALPNTGNFVECRWLDTSQDLEDPALGTILRYCRYQFAMT